MTNPIISSTTITAIVTTDMSEKPFGFVTVGEGDEAQRYFVPKDVLQACGFSTTQFVEGAEVELDSTEAQPSPVCIRIHKIGEHEAGVDEVALEAAVAKALAPKPQPEKKSSKKGKGNPRRPNQKKGGKGGKPRIRGRAPVQVVLQPGAWIAAEVVDFDWNRGKGGYGFLRVTHVVEEDGSSRPVQSHEKTPQLFITGAHLRGFEDAFDNGETLWYEVVEGEGKNVPVKAVDFFDAEKEAANAEADEGADEDDTVVDMRDAATG